VCDGCTYESYLRGTLELPGQGQIPSVVLNPLVVTYATDSKAVDELARGDGVRLDAVISALPTLEEAIDTGEAIRVVGGPLFTEELAVAMLKDAPLDSTSFVQRVSQIIQELHADGTLTSLSNKWYGTDLTTTKAAANRCRMRQRAAPESQAWRFCEGARSTQRSLRHRRRSRIGGHHRDVPAAAEEDRRDRQVTADTALRRPSSRTEVQESSGPKIPANAGRSRHACKVALGRRPR
jgi:hypothetical protein